MKKKRGNSQIIFLNLRGVEETEFKFLASHSSDYCMMASACSQIWRVRTWLQLYFANK